MKTLDPREQRPHVIVNAINQLAHGRSVVAGSVTLTVNVATTTVSNDVIPAGCFPQLTPRSSAAAAEVASVYVSSVAKGSFVITHPNNATAGRVWHWHAVGA